MVTLFQTLSFVLNLAWLIVIASIVMSWLVQFQVLNIRQPLVHQIYFGIQRLLEPIYRPIRKLLPNTAGLDFAPLIVIIGLFFIQQLLENNRGFFG